MLILIILNSLTPLQHEVYLEDEGEKLIIFATIGTFSRIVKDICGDRGEVYTIIPESAEPHQYQIPPSMINRLREASLLVFTGHIESIEDKLKTETNIPYVTLEDYIKHGLTILEIPGDGKNLHGYWLYPPNAIAIAEAVAEKLKDIDPSNSEYYDRQLEKFKREIHMLMDNVNNLLVPRNGLNMISVALAFPAAQYIAYMLQLKVKAFISRGEGILIGSSEMLKIEDEMKRGEIKYILMPDISLRTQLGEYVKQLSSETETPIVIIKTIGGWEFNTYADFIYYNVGLVIGALKSHSYINRTMGGRICEGENYYLILIILALTIILTLETWKLMGRY